MVIDAHEGRHIATFDIPGAYLHVDIPEYKHILLKLKDEFIEIMCDVNEEYRKNVVIENGKRVLCIKVVRDIYGCIHSAFLWYDLYTDKLKDMGFEINPYDKCIENKTINGNQCTIGWYVYDKNISHKEAKFVNDMLTIFKEKFWDLTITRGNSNDFIGMYTTITKEKRVEIDMRKKIEEAIEIFRE